MPTLEQLEKLREVLEKMPDEELVKLIQDAKVTAEEAGTFAELERAILANTPKKV